MTFTEMEDLKAINIDNGNIVVEVSGGVIVEIYGLPLGKTWTLIDWDDATQD